MQFFSKTEGSKQRGSDVPRAASSLAGDLLWAGVQEGSGAPADRRGGPWDASSQNAVLPTWVVTNFTAGEKPGLSVRLKRKQKLGSIS